jgi:uncharacterized protein YjbI with pentapeptide repeats
MDFIDCQFVDCNLSLVTLNGTLFQEASFRDCKMLGLKFENCNKFGLSVYFRNCTLNNSSFYRAKMKKTVFIDCNLQHVDFSEADLFDSSFENSDLEQAVFDNSNLEKVDFRGAKNFIIDPEKNRMKQAKFLRPDLMGLLLKYNMQIE